MGSSASQNALNPYEKPESTIDVRLPDNSRALQTKQMDDGVQQSKKDEIYLLRRMFYKLDPAVMKDNSETNYGQIKLSVKYVSSQEMLLVKVFEIRYLTAKSVRGHSFNPYVKVELTNGRDRDDVLMLPENATKYTNVINNSNKLIFDEIFSFKLPQESFEDLKLRCSVHSSGGLDQDDFFGEIYLDVLELDCLDVAQTSWHDLQALTDITIGGKLDLHLGYKLPQTLTVTINSARSIKESTDQSRTALTVRVFIPGVPFVFKTTPVTKNNDGYEWIETFSFPVPKEELVSRYLVLVVTDANEDDSYLGECHVDLENLDIARGFEGTFELTDMRGKDVVRSRWNKNAVTQELQEALHAHSVYMRPHFLFDPSSPKTKAVSVSVPKAFVHSQMRVVNGVVVQ